MDTTVDYEHIKRRRARPIYAALGIFRFVCIDEMPKVIWSHYFNRLQVSIPL